MDRKDLCLWSVASDLRSSFRTIRALYLTKPKYIDYSIEIIFPSKIKIHITPIEYKVVKLLRFNGEFYKL